MATRLHQAACIQMDNSDTMPVLNDYNLIGSARRNKPLQNATQQLVNTFWKVANALPTTRNFNLPSWIWHAAGFISVC